MTITLKGPSPNRNVPTMAFCRASRAPRHSIDVDEVIKVHSIMIDIMSLSQNVQLNGLIWLVDWSELPFWAITHMLSPILIKNIIQSVLVGTPLRLKAVYFLNCPLYVYTMWMLGKPFVPQKLKKRVHLFRQDWTSLFDFIDEDLIPDEYGGTAGSIDSHEEAFYYELMSFADNVIVDNQFGFQLPMTL
ncbi:hypothetical protein CHUAL_001133 [Chamberlinius hualienensis]